MSKRFGRPKGPTKEDIEREAEREVARLRQQTGAAPPGPGAGGGPGGGGFGTPGVGGPGGFRTPLDDIAESARGRSARRGESPSPADPGYGPMASGPVGPGGYGTGPFGGGGPFVGGGPGAGGAFGGGRPPSIEVPEFEDPDDESASITELALRDHAARYGTNPEDLVIRSDPVMAEAMRDEAMRKFMERQQSRQTQATVTKLDPSQTVLGRLAARRKAREEGREPEPEPESTGGGLLGRLGRVQEDDDDAGLSPLERRARDAARRREEMQHSSGQVFAMPTAAAEQTGSPELAAVAARLSAKAKPRRGASAEAPDSPPPPTRAATRKAPAKKATGRKAPARSAGPAKKTAATKAPARATAKATKATKGAARPSRSTTAITKARATKKRR